MKLEQYLQALKECPDKMIEVPRLLGHSFERQTERNKIIVSEFNGTTQISSLEYQYGIADNFPILLRADSQEFLESLLQDPEFSLTKEDLIVKCRLKFKSGEGVVDLSDETSSRYGFTTTCGHQFLEGDFRKIIQEKQVRDYNNLLILHCGVEGLHSIAHDRHIADLVIAISKHFAKNSACFSRSYGVKDRLPIEQGFLSQAAFSRIVYYPDSVDDEMQRLTKEIKGASK